MVSSCFLIGRRSIFLSSELLKGHSKWQNIKEIKGKNDLLKSRALSILLKKVKSAVSRGGFDPKLNKELGGLEQDFRSQGLPLDTFRNFLVKLKASVTPGRNFLLQKNFDFLKEKPEHEVVFNVIGPSGTFFIVEAETESRKMMENTMRKYFNKVGGFRFASDPSAVQSWFQQKGIVNVKELAQGRPVPIEKMEEIGIELDCEDVSLVESDGRTFELVCESENLSKVESALADRGFVACYS
uniref:Transcriptional regulatory protein n=1 Tax=Angiostrongylus cantonensis TaxID=6313 RepID=A0A158P9H0_ANGCA